MVVAAKDDTPSPSTGRDSKQPPLNAVNRNRNQFRINHVGELTLDSRSYPPIGGIVAQRYRDAAITMEPGSRMRLTIQKAAIRCSLRAL